jgi:hypothetical protein
MGHDMKNSKFNIQTNNDSQVLDSNNTYKKLIELFGKEKATKIMFSCEIYGTYESILPEKLIIKKIIE